MVVSKTNTIAPIGFGGLLVEVECDLSNSLPSLQIVGLGNKSIDEARERVKSAITNTGLEYPKKRITINLAPAETPKDGTHYDLPIALSILCSSGQIKQHEINDAVFAGELALDGSIRPVRGIINIAQESINTGIKTLYVPKDNLRVISTPEKRVGNQKCQAPG
jgi:magnesium chelatase family protein